MTDQQCSDAFLKYVTIIMLGMVRDFVKHLTPEEVTKLKGDFFLKQDTFSAQFVQLQEMSGIWEEILKHYDSGFFGKDGTIFFNKEIEQSMSTQVVLVVLFKPKKEHFSRALDIVSQNITTYIAPETSFARFLVACMVKLLIISRPPGPCLEFKIEEVVNTFKSTGYQGLIRNEYAKSVVTIDLRRMVPLEEYSKMYQYITQRATKEALIVPLN